MKVYSDGSLSREVRDSIELYSNMIDGMTDKYIQGRYDHKLGTFLSDLGKITSVITPFGPSKSLVYMSMARKPRPYERQLWSVLFKAFNNEEVSGELKSLLPLVNSHLNEPRMTSYRDGGLIDTELYDRIDTTGFQWSRFIERYGKEYTLHVVKYYIDYWYIV